MTDHEAKASRTAELKGALARDNARAAAILGEIVSEFQVDAIPLMFRAARGSTKREQALAGLLLARGDAGCRLSDQAIERVLADPAHPARDMAVQMMANHAARIRFAPSLREIARNRQDPHWAWAVNSLGRLSDRGAVDILMDHTCGQDTPFVLLSALVGLRCPEAALVFEPNLTHPDPRTRVFALWGLAALNYAVAVGVLVSLLDDPDHRTPTQFEPGQSRRAAQALADVHGWPFEWSAPSAVEDVKRRCRELYPADFVETCRSALARGSLSLPGA